MFNKIGRRIIILNLELWYSCFLLLQVKKFELVKNRGKNFHLFINSLHTWISVELFILCFLPVQPNLRSHSFRWPLYYSQSNLRYKKKYLLPALYNFHYRIYREGGGRCSQPATLFQNHLCRN